MTKLRNAQAELKARVHEGLECSGIMLVRFRTVLAFPSHQAVEDKLAQLEADYNAAVAKQAPKPLGMFLHILAQHFAGIWTFVCITPVG